MTSRKADYLLLFKQADICRDRLVAEAAKLEINLVWFGYEEVSRQGIGLVESVVGDKTILLLRGAYDFNTGCGYEELVTELLSRYRFARISDEAIWRAGFGRRENKKWQTELFASLGIEYAPEVEVTETGPVKYPVIVKKKLGALGKSNWIIRTEREWRAWASGHEQAEYLTQEYFRLQADVRVLMLGGRVVGAVRRRVREKLDGRVGVRVVTGIQVSRQIELESFRLAEAMEADFVGIDVGQKMSGEYFFIETNLSPFFLGFERATGINVAKLWLEYYQ